MEIGARLKEARVEKGLSLDNIQEATKIQKRYLVAIEEGNFEILPGKFYARAFIKEYATAVGLDSNELLEEYKEEIPQADDTSTVQYTRIQRSRKENHSDKSSAIFSFIPTIIVVILVVGIAFAAWYFYQQQQAMPSDNTESTEQPDDNEIIYNPGEVQDNQNDNAKANDDTKKDNAAGKDNGNHDNTEDQSEEDKQAGPELTVVETGSGSSPESTLALKNAGEEVKITLVSDGKSYLGMENADGKTYYASVITADDSPKEFDISGDERIYLNVGYAPDLTITINGVEVNYPVDPEEEVHQKLWINLKPTTDETNE